MDIYAGLDIGGTKCAVTLGHSTEDRIDLIDKVSFPTAPTPAEAIRSMIDRLDALLAKHPAARQHLKTVGVSCGGPLDSSRGILLSPPNLPSWDRIDVLSPLKLHFGVPSALQNDANACALAEWLWGAGRGSRNMIFLTFGTGMGAGLILNGQLYTGANDLAGEVGHIRITKDGPVGHNKAGSFEGFCSGGGITRLAQALVRRQLQAGRKLPLFCPNPEAIESVTTKDIAEAAHAGDPLAIQIFQESGRSLGRGLAILIDIINPEKIVIGSIYGRQKDLLEPYMLNELRREALPASLSVCEIVPAGLGEEVGDIAALSVARTLHLNRAGSIL